MNIMFAFNKRSLKNLTRGSEDDAMYKLLSKLRV